MYHRNICMKSSAQKNVIRCIKGTSANICSVHLLPHQVLINDWSMWLHDEVFSDWPGPLISPQCHMTKSHWIGLFITWSGHMTKDPLYALPPKTRHITWRLELNCEHLYLLNIECWLYCWTLYLLQLILLDFVIIATYIWWTCFYGTCILWTYICNWYGQYMYQLPVEELVLSFVFMQQRTCSISPQMCCWIVD